MANTRAVGESFSMLAGRVRTGTPETWTPTRVGGSKSSQPPAFERCNFSRFSCTRTELGETDLSKFDSREEVPLGPKSTSWILVKCCVCDWFVRVLHDFQNLSHRLEWAHIESALPMIFPNHSH